MSEPGGRDIGANSQLLRLSALLDLEQRARNSVAAELGYLMVNDTLSVVPYQQAAFWRNGRVAAVSGVAAADPDGPYYRWLARTMAAAVKTSRAREIHPLDAASLGLPPGDWSDSFPPAALWCPLIDRRGVMTGGLLFGRHDPWLDGEIRILDLLAGTYAMSLALEELPRTGRRWGQFAWYRRRPVWAGVAVVLLLGLSLLPVRSSVLAPAELVAAAPFPVRAPFDGVVETVHVTPSAAVAQGAPLVSFDTTERRARLEIAEKAQEIARAEFREASQRAMLDPRGKGRLAVLQSKIAQADLEVAYGRSMLERAQVKAPAAGVAVFDDARQWSGRPLVLGERIMIVAPARGADLDIHVPVSQVVTFEPEAEVLFFSNVSPDRPSHGRLAFAGYASAPGTDGVLSYIFRAHLDDVPEGLRLGLKGTAKIFGPRAPFLFWVLRRPLGAVREWLSF